MTLLFILIFCNIGIWILALVFSYRNPSFLGLITIAYGLGLRHAVDADHIAAIDNTTRKLMNDGKKPVSIGLFFSLGHSTVVIILSVFIAFSSLFIKHNLAFLRTNGNVIGTSISSFFLLLIGFINLIIFFDILKVFKKVSKNKKIKITEKQLQTTGFLSRFFSRILATISASWQMYFVGFLFGLGFDTASEVGLLSISQASSATGISFMEIWLLPLAFTAGMVFIDTLDGILMLGTYGWAYIQPVKKLYYNLNITFISVIIALFIGGIEAIQLLSSEFNFHEKFFQVINTIDLGKLGYLTITIFVLFWIISFAIFKVKRYNLR
jgi:high-affinity nickel-transport protein